MNAQEPYRPIAVRQVAVDRRVEDLTGLEGYDKCLTVLRYRGDVIGQAILPVRDGRVDRRTITGVLTDCAGSVCESIQRPRQEGPRDNSLVSVIVCTHNRATLLRNCLRSLTRITWENREIIVVDSHPINDETRAAAAEFPAVRYVLSPRRGLDIARNAGMAAAGGSIMAFTDDDAEVDPDWVHALVRNFADPTTAIVTGVTLPLELETEAQFLFEKGGGFRRGTVRFDLTFQHVAWAGAAGAGVNMAIRRDAAISIGPFDEALDGGTATMSGGDHEYFSRALIRGHKIVYDPGAVVWHRHRRDMDSVWGTMYGYGVGVYAWWTRTIVVDREYGLAVIALSWLVRYHLMTILRAGIGFPGTLPFRFALAEFLGALRGPFAYLQARFFSRL